MCVTDFPLWNAGLKKVSRDIHAKEHSRLIAMRIVVCCWLYPFPVGGQTIASCMLFVMADFCIISCCFHLQQAVSSSSFAGYSIGCRDDSHTCAIDSDKILRCWGSNGYGQTTVPGNGDLRWEVSSTLSCCPSLIHALGRLILCVPIVESWSEKSVT